MVFLTFNQFDSVDMEIGMAPKNELCKARRAMHVDLGITTNGCQKIAYESFSHLDLGIFVGNNVTMAEQTFDFNVDSCTNMQYCVMQHLGENLAWAHSYDSENFDGFAD